MEDLYKSLNYREFLRKAFPGKGEKRGRRSHLAKELGCQTSFVSLVLTERAHFNEDMIFATARFLELETNETEYLLLIFRHERAGTQTLRSYYQEKIKVIRSERKEVGSRVFTKGGKLPLEIQAQYYSSWIYAAIHILTMNPKRRTIPTIASTLGISERQAESAVQFLVQWQMLKKTSHGFEPGTHRVHLESASPFIVQHHRNWMLEAARRTGERRAEDFNYSGAMSLSKTDVAHVREMLLKTVGEIEREITPSPDEEMIGLVMSCFKF